MSKIINVSNLSIRNVVISVFAICALVIMSLPFIASAEVLTRQLQLGMSGSDVSSLQIFLAKDATIYPQGLVTGYFGFLTKAAVSNFQVRNGIANVGRVGPITLVAINNQMNGDSFAPFISGLTLSTSNNSVAMNWNTNENSSAIVYYSASPLAMTEASPGGAVTIGGTSILVHSDLRVSHSATLTGLNANTTYYYVVYVRDGAGNETVTWPATFQTTN